MCLHIIIACTAKGIPLSSLSYASSTVFGSPIKHGGVTYLETVQLLEATKQEQAGERIRRSNLARIQSRDFMYILTTQQTDSYK